ncbi:MAG: hypothetical protein QOJ99_445, partial [Bryobacterales bacterium]|nr:hypothetical protein [Bryobacterales bacterium]
MKPAAKSIPIEKARPGLDFRLLFESTPGLFVVVLPDAPIFTIVAVSEAYLRAAKRSREELVDQGIFEVFATPGNPVHTATLQNLRSSFERVLSGRQPDSMLVQKYDIPDGTAVQERYWSPQNSPVFDSDGEVAFIIHRVEDVTDFARLKRIEAEHGELSGELHIRSGQIEAELVLRGRQVAEAQRIVDEHRRVEQQLLASETRFTMASAEAPIGMVLTTPDGQILEVNRAYMNMLGYTREELASGNSAHFTHPDDVAPTREFFASLRDGSRDTATLEKRYLRKDGELLWARASASMRRDPGGKATQLIAIIEDITERKRAEEKLRAIYDGTYEYIGLLAPDGTLLEANRAALEFAESSPKEVIGRPFWLMPWFTQTPGASEAAQEGVHRAAQGEFVRYEATVKHSSGDLLTFDISLHPIHDERGHVILIVPEGRNITDRKAMERRNAILVQLDDATRPLADPDEITLTAARLLGEYLQVNRCAYADVEDDEDTFNLTGDYNRDVPSIVGRYTFAQFGAECLRLMREGKPYIVEDAENDPRVGESVGSYRLTLIRSVICVPMFKAGRLVAAMAVHQTTPRKWKHEEVELLQLVASRCWESIERVHVTRELREREQRVRFLAESIPQMVWTATPDGMLDYVNSQGSTYFGVKPEAMMGTGWLKGVYPEDQERTVNRWQQSLATGNPYESAFRLLRGSDGTWRWHLARAQPLTGPAGNVVQWFGTCTDIEDERQAEVSLRQQWQTFDTALSHTPDFTYIFDLDGRFQYINRALLALLQKSFEQAVGKNFFDLDYPPDIAARLQRQIQQVIDTKEP